jgi:hypothetical protein
MFAATGRPRPKSGSRRIGSTIQRRPRSFGSDHFAAAALSSARAPLRIFDSA